MMRDACAHSGLGYTAGTLAAISGTVLRSSADGAGTLRSMQLQMEQIAVKGIETGSGVARAIDPLKRAEQQIWEEIPPRYPDVQPNQLPSTQMMLSRLSTWTSLGRPSPDEPMFDGGRALVPRRVFSTDLGSWTQRPRYAGCYP